MEATKTRGTKPRGTDSKKTPTLKAPFPYFGGKSRVASLVWERFGDVQNYVEPFAGSLAVLLGRPYEPKIETVNDADCFVANFWRALQHDAAAVARYADSPVYEADLEARHLWLIARHEFRRRMKTDPDFYDAKIAGWWVWGISAWIGSGWCAKAGRRIPHLSTAGMGVHSKLPNLLGGKGVHSGRVRKSMLAYFKLLAARLRRVRVCCGDWSRVSTPSVTWRNGQTAILLDPPYGPGRAQGVYAVDSLSVAGDARKWAISNGDNPLLRIALCGYEGEHKMPRRWMAVRWKAQGGYGSQSNKRGRENASRECIWFSPHCLTTAATAAPTRRKRAT